MTTQTPNLQHSPAWRALQEHYGEMANVGMREFFAEDKQRFEHLSLQFKDILLDYSKNRVTAKTLELLRDLAEQADVPAWIERMFNGASINSTEQRSVLHVALRHRGSGSFEAEGNDVMPEVREVLQKMRDFSDAVRSGEWRGYTDDRITDVVNIGIGGSDLGPVMVTQALRPFTAEQPRVHFVSNVDESQISDVLTQLDPRTTLFIIVSKSFTTPETRINANTAREWILRSAPGAEVLANHVVAVTNNVSAAREYGIDPQNVFPMWDWVGGRYSLWSAVGLSIALSIGMDNFESMLHGAYEMDEHFRSAPLHENLPVTLALLGIWYVNFFSCQTQAVLPYDQRLHRLPAYLQQADMESNGKSVDRQGRPVDYATGPVIFGEPGINGQHAFYQLIHQGTPLIPVDMIVPIESFPTVPQHHHMLVASAFAQAEALMRGKNEAEVREELEAAGMPEEDQAKLLPYKVFNGNRPSNMLVYKALTPATLGRLIALYEHKIFVQGVIWNINSFDQWGVELGKQLANQILPELDDNKKVTSHDSSTNGLINYYKKSRK